MTGAPAVVPRHSPYRDAGEVAASLLGHSGPILSVIQGSKSENYISQNPLPVGIWYGFPIK